jgi:hypothetical protein
MVGVLEKAILEANPEPAIAIVSDHGFATIDHELNPAVELVKAGLLTINANGQR